jgi:hypothetical protein
MNKKEPKKKFDKPTILKISFDKNGNKNQEIIQSILPEDKKGLELMAANELINYINLDKTEAHIIEQDRENPDFVISINDKKFGLELCELISSREARLREQSLAYQKKLSVKVNENICFKLLPKTNNEIPKSDSKQGEELLSIIVDFIKKYKPALNDNGIISTFQEPNFWFGYRDSIVSYILIEEDYLFWIDKLKEKWLADYSLGKIKPMLLLYRTGPFADIERLRHIISQIEMQYPGKFESVWYIDIKPESANRVTKIF